MSKIEKLERLLRYHRQNVFRNNEHTADCHARALKRLQKTETFKKMTADRRAQAEYVASEKLLRLWA